MALPLAVPLIAALGALLSSVVVAIVEAVGKKTFVAGVLVTAIMACYVTFTSLLGTQIQNISTMVGSSESWIVYAITILPSNTDECLAAIAASHLCLLILEATFKAAGIRAAA